MRDFNQQNVKRIDILHKFQEAIRKILSQFNHLIFIEFFRNFNIYNFQKKYFKYLFLKCFNNLIKRIGI